VLNASVEFDERTLQPTYRLIVGVAGASSGLEIARRFGISAAVINAAADLVRDSTLQATEYLRRIKRESEDVIALRLALEEERKAVAEKFARLDTQAWRREQQRQTEFDAALQKVTAEFEHRASQLISKIEDRSERIKAEREAHKYAAELKRLAKQAAQTQTLPSEGPTSGRAVRVMRDGRIVSEGRTVDSHRRPDVSEQPKSTEYTTAAETRPLRVGDRVRLRSFGSIGIVDQLKGDDVEVRVNALRLREKLENLELVKEVPSAKGESGKFAALRASRTSEVHLKATEAQPTSELNVIGRTTDEAVDAVDKFLDEASLASLSEVRIVHGHGTGALRRAIGELLQDHPHVMRFSPAPPNQGGTGATVVELRQ